MAMNFAPYQSSPPESERAKSPPLSPRPQRGIPAHSRNISSVADREDPWAAARHQRLPSPSQYHDSDNDNGEGGHDSYRDLEGPRAPFYNDYIGNAALEGGGATTRGYGGRGIFETSLGLNLGVEAALAYLLLPPAGGVVLLLFEHKSDYVRFHAWQSALLFSALFFLHIIFSWTSIISWVLFVYDIVVIGYLAYSAWRNAETLDRVEVPIFGRLASSFVDDE